MKQIPFGSAVGAMNVSTMMKRLVAVELELAEVSVNDRINILAYAICGYVVAEVPPGQRKLAVAAICSAMRGPYLAAMAELAAKAGHVVPADPVPSGGTVLQ